MRFKHLSIGKQLGLGFSVAILFLLVSGALSSLSLRSLNVNMHSLYDDRVVPLKGLKAISDAYAVDVIDAVNKANSGLITAEDALTAVHGARSVIEREWRGYMSTRLTPEEVRLVSEVQARFVPAESDLDRLESTLNTLSGQITGQLATFNGQLYATIDPISGIISELIDLQLHAAQVGMAQSEARYHASILQVLGLGFMAVVISLWIAFVITRGITRPLRRVVAHAQAVASGDLTKHENISQARNEIGQLLRAQHAMTTGLANVVSDVRQNAESVAAASAQIAQGNSDLSQRTEVQAAALEETSASMEEMGSSARQNADNAHSATQLAVSASEVAKKGGIIVDEVVATMRAIHTSSDEISDIIGVIDGIAFQTNILALNASVEAARAGEHGRGFAVVASEVRNLAQRSAESAKAIKTLIGTSVERVAHGATLVDQAGTTMADIVSSIHKVSDIVSEISIASSEQSTTIGQISEAIGQIDQTTQQNAALVEESTAAASSLKQQAELLVSAVAQFKLEHHSTPAQHALAWSPTANNTH
ncbi:methyl-accepting chemotaxis protein [Halomonas dongshanensis]|uniref:Methyl-accepting chemotaxis protein n=1 Tax=Halomonas dongshanensis TaxID=2890835 RepID=A0ABT2E9D5_9GAMM|nr:methyl-accepting chemotaxis protein [Halomonas dongshanensis]MCS2608188.1 methyl-accepting chemotaxis protein [Halomonas dongshanensis]